jgi:PAS domain S-box-containing protein
MAKRTGGVGASAVDGGTSFSSEDRSSPFACGGTEMQGQMFRSLADHSHEFIGMCDLEFKPFYVNEAGRRLVGLGSLEEACAVKVQDFFFPEDQRYVSVEFFPKVLREGRGEVEIRFRHFKTGAAVWMIYNVFQVRDAQGRVCGYATVSRDITERKRAEEQTAQSERMLSELIERCPFGIYIVDAAFRISRMNIQSQEGAFRNVRPVIGRPFDEVMRVLWPEGVAAEIIGHFRHTLETGQAYFSREFVNPRDDVEGVEAYEWELHRMRLPEGQWGVICYYFDSTELRRTQAALRASEARLKQAIGVAGLGTFEHDHRTDVIHYSPLMRELMRFGVQEEITLPAIMERVFEEDREAFVAAVKRAHDPKGDGIFEIEYRVAQGVGRVRWVSARSQTFFEGEGSQRRLVRTAGAALDVTARKEAQVELERLVAERTARLHELVGELEHFSYTITHDLKSPLRAMRGFAEMMSLTCGECDRVQAKEFLGRISTSAERMDRLIADALNYSRLVRQEVPVEEVDAGALLRGMLDSYPELQPDKARIRVEGPLPVVLANEAGLTQCFSNLLGNGVKFVKPGERSDIRVWASSREGWVRIWVEDKGIGISQPMLPRVFEMFTRGSKDYEGTGIGLALVRKVAQRMGGKVGVESEAGKGSRFWIELRGGEAKPGGQQAVASAGLGGEAGTVLYVEDEESDALFMEQAFKRKGLAGKLRIARDGRAAIDYMSGAGDYRDRERYPLPSLVLLDLNLPHVPGFGVLEWIRNNPDYARVPVVVFSSSTREDDRAKALQLGADEVVAKPSSGLKFGEVVEGLQRKWLGRTRLR